MGLKVKGFKEILAKLDDLPNLLSRRLIRESFKQALEPMKDAVKAAAPVDTGALQASIEIKPAKTSGTFVAVTVTAQGPGIARIEYGTDKTPPASFVRPAGDSLGQSVSDTACQLLSDKITEALKK